MSLFQLSDDSIGLVIEFLNSTQLLNLIFTGSKRVQLVITQQTRNWEIICSWITNFPFWLQDGPRLESLSVKMDHNSSEYPLRTLGRSLVPSVVQERLSTIKFGFVGCFSILHDSTLSKHAPNLRTLICQDLSVTSYTFDLSNIPSSVTKLILRTSTTNDFVSLSIADFADLLPRRIEDFELSLLKLVSHSDIPSKKAINWPFNLKRLRVHSVAMPAFFWDPPALLESLESCLYSSETDSAIPMEMLPKTMKTLRDSNIDDCVSFLLDSPMPPDLSDWQCGLISINGEEDLKYLSPRLEGFKQAWCLERIPGLILRTSVPSLTRLNIQGPVVLADQLPSHLTELGLPHNCQIETISQLPASLLVLKLDLPKPESMGDIPRNVTDLTLLTDYWKPKWVAPLKAWYALPTRLTTLKLDFRLLETMDCLSALPISLKKLHLRSFTSPRANQSRGRYEYEIPTDLKSIYKTAYDESLPKYLPEGLERLHLSMAFSNDCAWPTWLSNLQHLQKLRFISVTARDGKVIEPAVNRKGAHLKGLPPSLVQLSLPLDPYYPFPIDLFSHLPQSLRVLIPVCPNIAKATSSITNPLFARLPPKLTRFVWETRPSDDEERPEGLTKAVLDLLPPYLITFPFNSQLAEEWFRDWISYNDADKWLGYPPTTE